MTFSSYSFINQATPNEREHTILRSRPARHIACPQRLKYIHNINDGYIPYVEDFVHVQRSTERDGSTSNTHRLGLYNTADTWQKELMSLAQQVQGTLKPSDEPARGRLSRQSLSPSRQHHGSIANTPSDEQFISKRLLNRHAYTARSSSPSAKSDIVNEKVILEPSLNGEHQDHGIWLLPILCHILHIETIPEAQEWLVRANPTEKRLAMELISRTMQDMNQHENEFQSDSIISDPSFMTSNRNNLYWPYKCWQRQQQQPQTMPRISSVNDLHYHRCERATSPLRLVTPARRLAATANAFDLIERLPTRTGNDRVLSSVLLRAKDTPQGDTPDMPRLSSRLSTPLTPIRSESLSRRSYHITTSLSNVTNENDRSVSSLLRGKTPLV